MRTCRHVRTTLIAAAMFLSAAAVPGASADGLRLGVMPFASAAALSDQFRHLRAFLESELQTSVTVESAPDFQTFVQRLRERRYDLVFAAPHLAVLAARNANKPLLASNAPYAPLVRTPPLSATIMLEQKATSSNLPTYPVERSPHPIRWLS